MVLDDTPEMQQQCNIKNTNKQKQDRPADRPDNIMTGVSKNIDEHPTSIDVNVTTKTTNIATNKDEDETKEEDVINEEDVTYKETETNEKTETNEEVETSEDVESNNGEIGANEEAESNNGDVEINKKDNNLEELEKENIKEKDSSLEIVKNELQEVDLSVTNNLETITLKNPNEVYYEIYRSARAKAKMAKQTAIEAYLEARNIKNQYMLDDIEDSEESDEEIEDL